MEKYVATRSNLYAGRLMKKPECIVKARDNLGETLSDIMKNNGKRRDGSLITDERIIQIIDVERCLNEGIFERGILFELTPEITGNDLVYTDSSYEVSRHIPLIETDEHFKIDDPMNLDGLLRFLGYKENLTQKDIDKIYRTLICSQRILHRIMRRYKIEHGENGELIAGKEGSPCSLEIIKCLEVISIRKHHEPSINEPNYKAMEKKR